jgi:hypothetical protein
MLICTPYKQSNTTSVKLLFSLVDHIMGGAAIGAGGYIPHFCVTWGQGRGQVQNYIDVKQSAVKVCISNIFANSWSLSSLSNILIGYATFRYASLLDFVAKFTLYSACPYDLVSSMRNTCHSTSIHWNQSINTAPKKRSTQSVLEMLVKKKSTTFSGTRYYMFAV